MYTANGLGHSLSGAVTDRPSMASFEIPVAATLPGLASQIVRAAAV
jgi:hypothetical protein